MCLTVTLTHYRTVLQRFTIAASAQKHFKFPGGEASAAFPMPEGAHASRRIW